MKINGTEYGENIHINQMNDAMKIARAKRIGKACEILWCVLMLAALFVLGMMAFAERIGG